MLAKSASAESMFSFMQSHSHHKGSAKSLPESQPARRPDFVHRNGSRLHSHSKREVPYPFSYDKETLELYAVLRNF